MDLKYAAIAAVLVLAIAGFAQAFGGWGNMHFGEMPGNRTIDDANFSSRPQAPFGLLDKGARQNMTSADKQAFDDLRTGNFTSTDSQDLAKWYSNHMNYNATLEDARFQAQVTEHELMSKLYSGQSLSDSEIAQLNSIVGNLPSGEDFRGFGRMPQMMRFGMRGHKGAATPVASPTG